MLTRYLFVQVFSKVFVYWTPFRQLIPILRNIYVFLFIGKDLHGVDFEAVDSRIQSLEKRVFVDQGCFPPELIELRERVDLFKAKLEVFFVLEASIMMAKSAFVKICNIL